jgi:hypothetical protein
MDVIYNVPQVSEKQRLFCDGCVKQVKPVSTAQEDEHPSPLAVLLSSHASVPTVMPSPHVVANKRCYESDDKEGTEEGIFLVHIPSGQFHAWAPFGPHLKPASSLQ